MEFIQDSVDVDGTSPMIIEDSFASPIQQKKQEPDPEPDQLSYNELMDFINQSGIFSY